MLSNNTELYCSLCVEVHLGGSAPLLELPCSFKGVGRVQAAPRCAYATACFEENEVFVRHLSNVPSEKDNYRGVKHALQFWERASGSQE